MSSLRIINATDYRTQQPVECLIRDGVIVENGSLVSAEAAQVVDAHGMMLIPGAVDVHVHFRVPGQEHKEDFGTGSAAALAGGVTTVLDMPNTTPPITTVELLEEKLRRVQQEAAVTVGCYIAATPDNLDEVAAAAEIACGVKVAPYVTGASGAPIIQDEQALRRLFELDLAIPVVVHAEDEAIIQRNSAEAQQTETMPVHGNVRTREAAVVAVQRVLRLAQGTQTKLHITHISTADEVELIRTAKQQGIDVTCDVTPHHLGLTEQQYLRDREWLKVNPPLRTHDDTNALWRALDEGVIDMVASDHAPHLPQEKQLPYWDAPSGIPGVQTLLPFMLNSTACGGGLSWQRLVDVTSRVPAERFGLEGCGSLEIGSIADCVLVDPIPRITVQDSDMRSKCGWTPFDGEQWWGKIHTVIRHGVVVVQP